LNRLGESPLHIACRSGMASLTRKLLESGSNPNLQTPPPPYDCSISGSDIRRQDNSNPFEDETEDTFTNPDIPVGLLSPLHLAVENGFEDIVLAFVERTE